MSATIPPTASAVTISAFGKPTGSTQVVQLPVPKPGPNQVLINVKLRPVNPADSLSIMGVYPGFRPHSFPAVPGLEGVGIVAQTGSSVTRVHVGQRVVPIFDTVTGSGSFQEYVVLSEDDVVVVPDTVSDASAAQAIVNPITVLGMLNELQVPAGEYLLQSAAGSTLGRQVIQIAKSRGIKTVNLVRRSAQVDELKQFGGDIVVSTEGLQSPDDISSAILTATGGKRPYAAIDAVGGTLTTSITQSVRDGATVLLYGVLDGYVAHVDIPTLLFRRVTVKGYWIANDMDGKETAEGRRQLVQESLNLMRDGVFEPVSGEVFVIDQVDGAIAKSLSAARGGKVLLSN